MIFKYTRQIYTKLSKIQALTCVIFYICMVEGENIGGEKNTNGKIEIFQLYTHITFI